MSMYKLIYDDVVDSYCIRRKSDNCIFMSNCYGNADYEKFIEDVHTKGIEIVEGADYVGVTTYTEARRAEYPPIEDQLDKIYHSGIDAWKADIKAIKDKYPKTQVGITSIAPLPDWIDAELFDRRKESYIKATARLAQYELSAGVMEDGTYVIEPLPIVVVNESGDNVRNPLVVQDEKERAEAQEVINKTPQAVIDSINT